MRVRTALIINNKTDLIMKRFILIASILAFLIPGAGAQSLTFGYCGDLEKGLGTNFKQTRLKGAIEIPEEKARDWGDEAKISKVRIGFGSNSLRSATVMIWERLDQNPVYTQTVSPIQTNAWNEIELTTPYALKGKTVFVGYEITTGSTQDTPLGVDGITTDERRGDYAKINDQPWEHVGDHSGNLCIQAVITGGNLPQNDIQARSLTLPAYISPDVPFAVTVKAANNGVNAVESVEAVCEIEGQRLTYESISLPKGGIPSGKEGEIIIEGLVYDGDYEMDLEMTITISKVNGVDDRTPADNKLTASINCMEAGYSRSILVEEGTGTWCGWCPRGAVGLAEMTKKYGDYGFIGIAVHNRDQMTVDAYDSFLGGYIAGYPNCMIDRKVSRDPNEANLLNYYLAHIGDPIYANIDVEAEPPVGNSSAIQVKAKVKFRTPHSGIDYRVAFVLTEDGVGPYSQENYYAGGGQGAMGGWEYMPKSAVSYFDHVARAIYSIDGIKDCLPSDPETYTEYTVDGTLSIANVKNIEKCHVIGILLDAKSGGQVVNSCKFSFGSGEGGGSTSGAAEIGEDSLRIIAVDGGFAVAGDIRKCDVYNLDGKAVKSVRRPGTIEAAPGVYAVVATMGDGSVVSKKVIVK